MPYLGSVKANTVGVQTREHLQHVVVAGIEQLIHRDRVTKESLLKVFPERRVSEARKLSSARGQHEAILREIEYCSEPLLAVNDFSNGLLRCDINLRTKVNLGNG